MIRVSFLNAVAFCDGDGPSVPRPAMGDEQVRALVQCDGRNRSLLPDGDHGAGLGHGKERDRFGSIRGAGCRNSRPLRCRFIRIRG
jgi:hypothetical protein